MPGKRKPRMTKKASTKRKRAPRRMVARIKYTPLPFASSMKCSLVFVNNLWFAQATAAIPTGRGYRLNSLYDPNYTETGGVNNQQPFYYDQITTIYANYRVDSVHIKGTLTCSEDAYIQMRPQLVTTAPTNNILEDERNGGTAYVQASLDKPITVNMKYNINRIFGVSQAKYKSEENYSAEYIGNPANIAYWYIFGQAINPAATFTMGGRLSFTFNATFFNPRLVAES